MIHPPGRVAFRRLEAVTPARKCKVQDVAGSVLVPIMLRAASAAPLPYSELRDTFGAAECAALGTELGRPRLGDFHVPRAVPAGFVTEHIAEGRPTCVEAGFVRAECCISDRNEGVFPHKVCRGNVQIVSATCFDLGVQSPCPIVPSSALRGSEPLLKMGVVPGVFDPGPVRAHSKLFQTEIDADGPTLRIPIRRLRNFALHVEVPKSARVLSKTARPDAALRWTMQPQRIAFPAEDCLVATQFEAPVCSHERNPPKTASWSGGRSPRRALAIGVARLCESRRDFLKHVRADRQTLLGGSGEKLMEVERAGPWSTPSLSPLLRFRTKVPDQVHGPRKVGEVLGVPNAISKREQHRSHRVHAEVAHGVSLSASFCYRPAATLRRFL